MRSGGFSFVALVLPRRVYIVFGYLGCLGGVIWAFMWCGGLSCP